MTFAHAIGQMSARGYVTAEDINTIGSSVLYRICETTGETYREIDIRLKAKGVWPQEVIDGINAILTWYGAPTLK